jgi:hypothetical protein
VRKETAIFACLDGLTEVNTFFLIARRQWKAQVRHAGLFITSQANLWIYRKLPPTWYLCFAACATDRDLLGNIYPSPADAFPIPASGVCHPVAKQHSCMGTLRDLVLPGGRMKSLTVQQCILQMSVLSIRGNGTQTPESEVQFAWQAFLCIFNIGMVHRSLLGWWRQRRQQHWQQVRQGCCIMPPLPSDVVCPAKRAAAIVRQGRAYRKRHERRTGMLDPVRCVVLTICRLRLRPAASRRLSHHDFQSCGATSISQQATARTATAAQGPLQPHMWCYGRIA